MVSAFLTPASVHGVSQPRPASILLPTSQNTPMESAETGTTGKIRTFLRLVLFYFQLTVDTRNYLQLHIQLTAFLLHSHYVNQK